MNKKEMEKFAVLFNKEFGEPYLNKDFASAKITKDGKLRIQIGRRDVDISNKMEFVGGVTCVCENKNKTTESVKECLPYVLLNLSSELNREFKGKIKTSIFDGVRRQQLNFSLGNKTLTFNPEGKVIYVEKKGIVNKIKQIIYKDGLRKEL